MNINDLKAAIFGHAIADAMGVPVEFEYREDLERNPVTDYMGYGTHPVPAGTWSDDTSMTLAALDSLSRGLDYPDMMERFCAWKEKAAYTATDFTFDIGGTTSVALRNYRAGKAPLDCGLSGDRDNGNGALMRIIPAAFYAHERMDSDGRRLGFIHDVSALTHAHPRSKMGCGIYSFLIWALLENRSKEAVAEGLAKARDYYEREMDFLGEMESYERLFAPDFAALPMEEIKSTGYVVYTLEAAVWCLLNTNSYEECILTAVNLGKDTDTVGAVAGGLTGLLYGLEAIPEKWVKGLIRNEYVRGLCEKFVAGIDTTPRRMIDIHSHLLYGVDDGSRGIEMSLDMLRSYAKQGVTDVFCTSHNHSRLEQYEEAFQALRQRCSEEYLPVKLHRGCEIQCYPFIMDEIAADLKNGQIPTMNGMDYILVEFDPYETPEGILACVDHLREHTEYRIIIAHVERYEELEASRKTLDALMERDCLFQVNAYDLREVSDETVRHFAQWLLAERKIAFLGSDAHRPNHRAPAIESGRNYVYEHCPEEYADDICWRNAERLLLGN